MVNRPNAGADGGLDPLRAVRVGGHLASPSRGLDHGGLDLLVGVLLRAGRNPLREDGARRENLDEVGAVLEVRAHLFGDFERPIGEVVHRGDLHVRRELQRIAGAAGGRHVRAGHEHARPGHHARLDRVAQRDVHVGPVGPHVAHGREAGHERHARVLGAPERVVGRGRLEEPLLPVHVAASGEVRVQVDPPRGERRLPKVDHASAGRDLEARAEGGDLVALDAHHGGRQHRASRAVDQSRRLDDDDLEGGARRARLGERVARRKRECEERDGGARQRETPDGGTMGHLHSAMRRRTVFQLRTVALTLNSVSGLKWSTEVPPGRGVTVAHSASPTRQT